MAKKKLSTSEIASIIEAEGLSYAIEHFVNAENIADADLADMWERAAELLSEITDYVEDNSDDVKDLDFDEAPEEDEY